MSGPPMTNLFMSWNVSCINKNPARVVQADEFQLFNREADIQNKFTIVQ